MLDGLKPYSDYKDSAAWLNGVPSHWLPLPVRRFCKVFAGATPSRAMEAYWNGGTIPWLSSGDVNQRRIHSASQFITERGFANSSTKWIRPGSVVMALAGQGRTKGMVATVEFETTCNQSMAAIEPRLERCNHEFLAYYFESQYLNIRALVGDGLRDGLNLEHVKSLPVPLPPPDEQAGIVRFLGAVDRKVNRFIRAKRRLIEVLTEQKQAIITHAVTKGLNPHASFKPSGIDWLGDVPEHWAVARAGSVAEFISTKAHEQFVEDDGVHICVTARFVSTDGRSFRRCTQNFSPARRDDVLMVMSDLPRGRALARAYLVRDDQSYAVNQRVCILRPKRVDPRYLAFAANRHPELLAQDDGFNQTHLPNAAFKIMRLALPPLVEQAAIADSLVRTTSTIDATIDRTEREIDLIREYRKRLVADVVTGKVDVRAAATTLSDEAPSPAPIFLADEDAGERELADDSLANVTASEESES